MIDVITIDGPSGTGKGTISRLLAQRLGWHMLDSGALYRLVAVGADMAGIDYTDVAALADFALNMQVAFPPEAEESILLANQEVAPQVRLEKTGEKASQIAAVPEVRAALLQRQLAFRQAPGLVADGRDMGTVVFPEAGLKLYLTASAEERAQRRYKQLINKGVCVSLPALLHDIQVRDERDANRSVSPLKPAADALVIDTTDKDINQVLQIVLAAVHSQLPQALVSAG